MVGKKSLIRQLDRFRKKAENEISIEKVILFGSSATGKMHKWSDIDLIIVSDDFKGLNFFERGAKMYDYWNIQKPVDFICLTPEEFNKLQKGITIVKQAAQEGVEI